MEPDIFKRISHLFTFTQEEQAFISSLDLIQRFKKGTILLKEGQFSTNEYFVFEGCLRTYYIIDGEEKTTEFYTEFDPLSPACVTNSRPSEYFISCLEDTVLLVTNPQSIQQGFDQFPRFEQLCRTTSDKILAQKQTDLDNFKILSPEQRYLNLMEKKANLIQRVPQYHLASYLGITPQSLSRLKNRLAKK